MSADTLKLTSLSCPANGRCAAVTMGDHGFTYADGTWHRSEALNPGNGDFRSIGCPAPSACVAVSRFGYAVSSTGTAS